MIKKLDSEKREYLEYSIEKATEEELCRIKGREPNIEEKQAIGKFRNFSCGSFEWNRTSTKISLIFMTIVFLSLSILLFGIIASFSQEQDILLNLWILAIFFFILCLILDVILISTLFHIFVNGKPKKLKNALKNGEYTVISTHPIGYISVKDANRHVKGYKMAFQLKEKGGMWFHVEGDYDPYIGYIDKDKAILLRFCVDSWFKKQLEYEYVAVVL